MNKKEILKHNKTVVGQITSINETISDLENDVKQLQKDLIAPCDYCPYDGVYRCEACQEDNYAGFNVKEYPREG